MDLKINISTNSSCNIVVEDQTQYLPEDSTAIIRNQFKKSDTFSFAVLEHKDKYGKAVFMNGPQEFPITFDGKFIVHFIVLPSKEWVEKAGSQLDLYSKVYYTDGTNFYILDSIEKPVKIEEILEINSVGTSISKISKEYVSICFLYKCYLNLCKQILNSRILNSCQKRQNLSELTYKRDLAWSAINVVRYLVEFRQLDEATRIIDQITQCNGVCSDLKQRDYGCGCK